MLDHVNKTKGKPYPGKAQSQQVDKTDLNSPWTTYNLGDVSQGNTVSGPQFLRWKVGMTNVFNIPMTQDNNVPKAQQMFGSFWPTPTLKRQT